MEFSVANCNCDINKFVIQSIGGATVIIVSSVRGNRWRANCFAYRGWIIVNNVHVACSE